MAQESPRNFVKRADPIAVPTASGIEGGVTATGATVTNSLAVDSGAPTSAPGVPPPGSPVLTIVESATAFTSQTSATQSDAVSAGSSKSISLGTVIGSCVGAFIFVAILIILGIWFYRRYSESLKEQAKARGPKQRRRSRLEAWKKLEEGENQTKEVDHVVPMEKLTMFKRGASVRTAYTHKSVDEAPLTYPRSFAPFDTNLVRTLSADNTAVPHSQPSQDANSVKGQAPSNLSPSSNSLRDPLSPSLNMAIPTPEATVLQPHKWESAEVVHYAEGQSVGAVASTGRDKDTRSAQNPFFGSQDYTRSRANSDSTERSPTIKDQERINHSSMASSDPFDAFDAQLSRPVFAHHHATDSSTSTQSKDRALQTLMHALELSEDEVRERLRVASMQPSVISQLSQHSPIDEEDFTKNFLLPTLGGKI